LSNLTGAWRFGGIVGLKTGSGRYVRRHVATCTQQSRRQSVAMALARSVGRTAALGVLRSGVIIVAGAFLTACSSTSSMNPINWWHTAQGGKIAEQRPPAPGTDDPYPNLSTVPDKPAAPDKEAMKQLTAALVADRANAQHLAASAPLADPSSPSTAPGLFGVGSAPPPQPMLQSAPGQQTTSAGKAPAEAPVASASLPAVEAPPPATPPVPAPRASVQSAPLAAAEAATAGVEAAAGGSMASDSTPAAAPTATAVAPAPASAPASASPAPSDSPAPAPLSEQPALPLAPPPRPEAAGSPPPPPPPPAPKPTPLPSASGTAIMFVAGSSQLLQPARDSVAAFAATRGNKVISVTGYGDGASDDPIAQAQAVGLGLARAQAIATVLSAAGVPADAIRVNAEATGRGASLRLLQ